MSEFTDNVAAAANAMRGLFAETPLQENVFLGQRYDSTILLKREDLSPVRSYKIRGAFNFFRKCLETSNPAGFVCASAGNHAQGFAYVCQYFGKKGVVFMPVTTPQQKIEKTRAFGGAWIEIRLVGDIFDQCYSAAIAYAQAHGGVLVSPFDHPDIIEGQATVAHEVLAQLSLGQTLDRVHVAVGGGGLSSGMVRYFSDMDLAPEFMFVEPLGAPSLKNSLAKGQRVDVGHVDNFVDGASVALMGEYPFEILKRFSPENVDLVPEDRLCMTMIEMLNVEGIVLEPAGALAVDALKDVPLSELKGKNVLCIASGGNFDFERLAEVKERALRYSGVKKYFVLHLPQRPGALRDFLNLLGPDDDISRFEYLKKSSRNFGSILIGIETKDANNFAGLKSRMTESGFVWQDITENELVAGLLI